MKKKNAQYVGVDEKFIPEKDKYVEDNAITAEINNEMRRNSKRYVKAMKGIFIGRLIVTIMVFAIAICAFVFIAIQIARTEQRHEEMQDNVEQMFENYSSEFDRHENKADIFNMTFAGHEGSANGTSVIVLLQQVINSNDSGTRHLVAIEYEDGAAVVDDGLIGEYRDSIDGLSEYSVKYSYDKDGFLEKITINKI